METEEIFQLLKDFNSIPKKYIEPTFLEICRYPRRRFEEISSRILSFYFNPLNEHNLNDLFIKSLFEMISWDNVYFKQEQIKIVLEDNADRKRIDLVIFSDDFIVGIENKITASLYNPLDFYKKRLDQYKRKNTVKVVLSLFKISNKQEIDSIKKNGFVAFTYLEFFSIVKRNIGKHISASNTKYLIQLYDFIQTLENMSSQNTFDKRLSEFFYDNSNQIKELTNSYEKFKQQIINIQKEKINELKENISNDTGRNWWVWEGWVLGVNSYNNDKPNIGIEASFQETRDNPLGIFNIYIAAWKIKDWAAYKEVIMRNFSNKISEQSGEKVTMLIESLAEPTDEIILEKLKSLNDFIIQITS